MENKELEAVDEQKLVLQGDPEKQLEFAQKSSQALMKVIEGNKTRKQLIINGKKYLQFEDWQTLARFYGASVGVEWTKEIIREDKLVGFEAKANVLRGGELISAAEAICMRSEKNWATRDEFALRSMAQTRACAKALRNVFSWVAVLAGFEGTPAEEVTDDMRVAKPVQAKPVEATQTNGTLPMGCSFENCTQKLTPKVYDFSVQKFGKPLCFDHQKQMQ